MLKDADSKDIIREAKFLCYLKHENLVEFVGMHLGEQSLMLEYLSFDFASFGKQVTVSNLEEFLHEMKCSKYVGFEHFPGVIAKDVVNGVKYLHAEGVAHRDLKPSNVLISNKLFLQLHDSDPEKHIMWQNAPCLAKLMDFGQSWGNICQTSIVGRSHTIYIFKGTIAFMAPEIINPKQRPICMKEEELKKADIWSLGTTIHCLINPSYQIPYLKEARKAGVTDIKQFITEKVSAGILPEESDGYEWQQATVWLKIRDTPIACLKRNKDERPTASHVLNEEEDESEDYPLNCCKGTALDRVQALGIENGEYSSPQNDATKACNFLALKISECILLNHDFTWSQIKNKAENIIMSFPDPLNDKREINELYSLEDAFDLLRKHNLISKGTYSYISKGYKVFSKEGRSELERHLEVASESKSSIITVPPYSFIIGKHSGSWFALDTHVINKDLGGNGNGLLKVFEDPHLVARWTWKRLAASGVKSGYLELVDISFSK